MRTGDAELMRWPQALEFPLDASDGAGMCSAYHGIIMFQGSNYSLFPSGQMVLS